MSKRRFLDVPAETCLTPDSGILLYVEALSDFHTSEVLNPLVVSLLLVLILFERYPRAFEFLFKQHHF